MTKLICPVCDEPAESGQPNGARVLALNGASAASLKHRHAADREPLCPTVGTKGYEPAAPRRA